MATAKQRTSRRSATRGALLPFSVAAYLWAIGLALLTAVPSALTAAIQAGVPNAGGAAGNGNAANKAQPVTADNLLQLSTADWSQAISRGAWLIEFTSPFCASCRGFASTWLELNANKHHLQTAYPDAPFSLAQVDCHADVDLCEAQGVKHMPRLSVYRDGVQITSEFQGNREYTELSAFIDGHAAEYRQLKGSNSEPHPFAGANAGAPAPGVAAPPAAQGANAPLNGAGPQPQVSPTLVPPPPPIDMVNQKPVPPPAPAPPPPPPPPPIPAPAPPVSSGPNPHGSVLQYGKDEVVKDMGALRAMLDKDSKYGATFVKFFAPWCPHCRAMAGAFTRVAEALKGRVNVVEVNCEDYRNVCGTFGIAGFPTLRMYNEGEATEFHGSRSFEAMHSWALKAGSAAGVRQIDAGELPAITHNEEVFFLYLHSANTPKREVDAVTHATRVLLTTPVHAYRSSDLGLISRYESRLARGTGGTTSGLLAFKDHDSDRPTAALFPSTVSSSKTTADATTQIGAWLDRERFPTVIELTSQSFNDVISNRQDAPVVLAALSDVHHSGRQQGTGTGATLRDAEVQALRELALKWRERHGATESTQANADKRRPQKVLFAWIDADRWASALKKYYNVKSSDVPRLILADGARLEYYDLPSRFVDPFTPSHKQSWLHPPSVFEALDAIWLGKGPRPKSSRTYLDRGVQGTASLIEGMLVLIAHHIFLSLCLIVLAVGIAVSCMRRQAAASTSRRHASQRLPQYGGKSD